MMPHMNKPDRYIYLRVYVITEMPVSMLPFSVMAAQAAKLGGRLSADSKLLVHNGL